MMTEKQMISYIESKGFAIKNDCLKYGNGLKILRYIKKVKRKKRLFTKKQIV